MSSDCVHSLSFLAQSSHWLCCFIHTLLEQVSQVIFFLSVFLPSLLTSSSAGSLVLVFFVSFMDVIVCIQLDIV